MRPELKPFDVIYHVADLHGHTVVTEIGPGKFKRYLQEGFIFIDDADFTYAEGVVKKYFPKYDHWRPNNISKTIGLKIAKEWREVAEQLRHADKKQIKDVMHSLNNVNEWHENYMNENRENISSMLIKMADFLEGILKTNKWFCILGP